MRKALALALALAAVSTSGFAQTGSPAPKEKTTSHKSSRRSGSSDIQELKDAVAAQQQQIQQLQQQVSSRDQAIQQLQQQIGQAQTTATQAQQDEAANATKEGGQITANSEQIGGLQHNVSDLTTLTANTADALQDTQKRVSYLEAPNSIAYKGVTITPGGFLAAETVWRSHATLGDINTQLNGIPFSAASQARLSEFYGTGRQSRISMLVQGKLSSVAMTGYVEADFLGAGVTSNNNESNSYVLRQRQLWGQAALTNGWTFTGGQMWSLVTEDRVGLDNRAEALPMTIDPQYTVGFSWARQYGFRATKNFHNKVWFGVSVENSQELLTAAGVPGFAQSPCPSGSAVVTSSTSLTGTAASCPQFFNYDLGGPGNLGGLYNSLANYSSNVSPDYIVKMAFQPGFGHYEIFGVASDFRERIYPNASLLTSGASLSAAAAGAFNNSLWGGGYGGNARWQLAQKKVEFGLHFLGGNGVGRYGTSTLPDVTVYSNGYLHMIRSYQGLASLEFHLPKWDWYFYGGEEYAGRNSNAVTNSKGVLVPTGYGSPLFSNTGCGKETLPTANTGFAPGPLGSCTGNTHATVEGTAGLWYRFYNGPKGRLQMGLQYSYLERVAWSGVGGTPKAVENMGLTSFRYYLP